MKEELKRTYKSYKELPKRNQIEYTEPTQLFGKNGEVLVRGGWARKDVFLYDKKKLDLNLDVKNGISTKYLMEH